MTPAKTPSVSDIRSLVRDVPDFPKKGILFKDITTVLQNGDAFRSAIDRIVEHFAGERISSVVCVEARGFVLGSAVAYALGCGLVPVRKKGKLPWRTRQVSYELEYGRDFLEIHEDALSKGERVIVVDDLLATGGTVAAVITLVRQLGAEIVGIGFFIELSFLKGRDKLPGYPVYSVIQY